MEPQKVYINERDEASIICAHCGKKRRLIATKYKQPFKPIMVKCPCGFDFPILFEKRKHYRKQVNIPGEFTGIEPPGERGVMHVKDISRTGVGFETERDTKMQLNDIVKLKFTLDDGKNSVISKSVIIRFVKGRCIGSKFCDDDIGRALAFYLMP